MLDNNIIWTRKKLALAGLKDPTFKPNATYILPELVYYKQDEHTLSRVSRCIVCQKTILRKHWRKAKVESKNLCVLDSPKLLEKVKV